MYHYLVKDKKTGKKRLIEASSPAVAIAFVAGDNFTAQRCEGDTLDIVKDTIPIEKMPSKVKAEPAKDGE